MFRNVQLRVKQTIGQDPWLSFPSLPAIYFAGAKPPENVELTFWASVKDSANPAVLNTYLQRYPNGEFSSIARALIDHYERQLNLELAAREGERRRHEEAMKAVEAKRLEDEQRAREARLTEERKRAEETKNRQEAARLEKERAELSARNEELKKALEEVRIARDAAKAAEEQRLAALKAAESATKTAEEAIRKKAEEKTGAPAKLAALPTNLGPTFDGNWGINWMAVSGCQGAPRGGSYSVRVVAGKVSAHNLSGTISPTGRAQWTFSSRFDGSQFRCSGTFRGEEGSGTCIREIGHCQQKFTLKLNARL